MRRWQTSNHRVHLARLFGLGSERLQADLMLLAVALIWGVGFVVNRLAALQVGALVYNGVRFVLGTLTLVPFVWQRLRSFSRLELWGGVLAGLVLFAASAFQQMGLQFTTAGKAAFITGLRVFHPTPAIRKTPQRLSRR